MTLADTNADGHLDITLVNNGGPNRFLRNNGDGVPSFTSVSAGALTTGTGYTMTIAFVDIDADGDVDALVGNGNMMETHASADDQVFLNDGTGVFAETTVPGVAPLITRVRHSEADRCVCGRPRFALPRDHAAARQPMVLTAVWLLRQTIFIVISGCRSEWRPADGHHLCWNAKFESARCDTSNAWGDAWRLAE